MACYIGYEFKNEKMGLLIDYDLNDANEIYDYRVWLEEFYNIRKYNIFCKGLLTNKEVEELLKKRDDVEWTIIDYDSYMGRFYNEKN